MSEKPAQHSDCWSPKEFSDEKNIGVNQVYEAIRANEIPSIRIGNRYFIPKVAWARKLSEA
jgi:hypothetical protein